MTKEEILAAYQEYYGKLPQYKKYAENPIWVKLKANTGRPGETWFKKGDLAFVTGGISPPIKPDNKFRIALYSWRKTLGKYEVGSCSVDINKVEFLDSKHQEKAEASIQNYLAAKLLKE